MYCKKITHLILKDESMTTWIKISILSTSFLKESQIGITAWDIRDAEFQMIKICSGGQGDWLALDFTYVHAKVVQE